MKPVGCKQLLPPAYVHTPENVDRAPRLLLEEDGDNAPGFVSSRRHLFFSLSSIIYIGCASMTSPPFVLFLCLFISQAAHCRMMPELRIKLGVVNKRTQQLAHVATLHEGLGLRTKKYYLTEAPEDSNGEYDAALGLPDIDNDAVNRGEQRSNQGGGGGGENEGMSRPAQPCWLGFSGEVALPESLGSGHPTHVVDIILVGSKKSVADQGSGDGDRGVPEEVTYSFSDIRVGPLFNLARSMIDGHPAGGANDLVDMLDLKLGGFTQYNNGHFGVQAV